MNRKAILVYGPCEAGLHLLDHLQRNRYCFFALALNLQQQQKLNQFNVQNMILADELESFLKHTSIHKALIFEDQISTCNEIMQTVRKAIPTKKVYVIIQKNRPMLIDIYKGLGAGVVICSHGRDMSFLVNDENDLP